MPALSTCSSKSIGAWESHLRHPWFSRMTPSSVAGSVELGMRAPITSETDAFRLALAAAPVVVVSVLIGWLIERWW